VRSSKGKGHAIDTKTWFHNRKLNRYFYYFAQSLFPITIQLQYYVK